MGADYITTSLSHAIKIHDEDLNILKSIIEDDTGYSNCHFIHLLEINIFLNVFSNINCLAQSAFLSHEINCGHQVVNNFEEIENIEHVICKYNDYVEKNSVNFITNQYNSIIRHLNETYGTTISDVTTDDILVVLTVKTR